MNPNHTTHCFHPAEIRTGDMGVGNDAGVLRAAACCGCHAILVEPRSIAREEKNHGMTNSAEGRAGLMIAVLCRVPDAFGEAMFPPELA